jgi:hypothetical protein
MFQENAKEKKKKKKRNPVKYLLCYNWTLGLSASGPERYRNNFFFFLGYGKKLTR